MGDGRQYRPALETLWRELGEEERTLFLGSRLRLRAVGSIIAALRMLPERKLRDVLAMLDEILNSEVAAAPGEPTLIGQPCHLCQQREGVMRGCLACKGTGVLRIGEG